MLMPAIWIPLVFAVNISAPHWKEKCEIFKRGRCEESQAAWKLEQPFSDDTEAPPTSRRCGPAADVSGRFKGRLSSAELAAAALRLSGFFSWSCGEIALLIDPLPRKQRRLRSAARYVCTGD